MPRFMRLNRTVTVTATAALVGIMASGGALTARSTFAAHSHARSHVTPGVLVSAQNTGDADWVKTLDPALVTDSVSISDIDMVNANLVKADYPSLAIVPDLATWTTSRNHKSYTFTIRANARFSNGDRVTAYDAAWSITRSLLPATKSPVATTYLGQIRGAAAVANGKARTVSGIKVLNQRQLRITLTNPVAYFLGALSYPTADVLDPRVMRGRAPGAGLTNGCHVNQGAGPFKFACTSGSGRASFYPAGHSPYMKFVPNPYYYGAKPTITVRAPMIGDLETNWRLYQAGSVDWTGVPTADLAGARSRGGFIQVPELVTDYITPNQQMAPFDNENCRLAVAYAIDRVSITKLLLRGTEKPLYDVLPSGLPNGGQGYFNNPRVAGVPYYDPAKARQYLNNCPGKLNGVSMTYQSTGQDITHEYDAVRANLQAIGANVTLKPLTFNAWLNVVGQSMQATKTQITENLWIDDYPDAQDWMANLLKTGANYDIGGFNNHTFDQLVNKGNVTFNFNRRAAYYVQAQKIALRTGAWIGVGQQIIPYVINPRIHNLIATASGVWPKHNDWSLVTSR